MQTLTRFSAAAVGLSLSVLGSASLSSAAELPASNGFFCQLHYTKTAYDKAVASVLAHTGVRKECPGDAGNSRWEDVKDRQLSLSADRQQFQGKIVMVGRTVAKEECTLTPVAQFFVNFEDGSQKIEEVVVMQTRQKFLVKSERVEDNQDFITWMNYLASLEDRAIDSVSCFSAWSLGDTVVDLARQIQPALLRTNASDM